MTDESGSSGKEARLLDTFLKYVAKVSQRNRDTLLYTASKMSKR
jgi:hypothetical protein